jgi:hypothetical protein
MVEFQAGLAYRVLQTSHVGKFFVFSLPTVDFNLQNLGFIPGYLMTFLECMHMPTWLVQYQHAIVRIVQKL